MNVLTLPADEKHMYLYCAGGENGKVILGNWSKAQPSAKIPDAHTDSVECIEFSPLQPWVVTGSLDSKVNVWDMNTGQKRNSFTCDVSCSMRMTLVC